MKYGRLILLAGSIIVALSLAFAPYVFVWGERHSGHERPQRLVLRFEDQIGQTFQMEENALSAVAVWVDTAQPLPTTGDISLEVLIGKQHVRALYPVEKIPDSGLVVFQFDKPLVSRKGSDGKYLLGLSEKGQRVTLQFQIDETKYPYGQLLHPSATRRGDLAFQLGYKRSALGTNGLQAGYALLIFACGIFLWWGLGKYPGKKFFTIPKDIFLSVSIGIAVAFFTGLQLLRTGYWIGPTDFTKDAAYLGAAAQAFKAFAWPLWEHVVCGGLPLMGSIEGNAISIGTLFALFLDPQKALMLMNTVEAGIAAAGMYALARFLSSSRIGSVLAAAVYGLSPVYLFKIIIGYSMIGGVFAYAPWVLLCFAVALRRASGWYAVVSGTLLSCIVLRGEAHIIVVLALLLVVWGVYDVCRSKKMQALLLLLMSFCMAFFVSSIKILPYLEHVTSEPIKLYPYVAPLIQHNLLFEALFTVQPTHENVSVLHGKYGEVWGVFGSYVGIVPVLLAVIGLFARKRYRGILVVLLLVCFLLAEGTLFEYAIRFVPPFDALLRMPVRNMLLVVLLIALFAGRGVDILARYALQIGILVFIIVDLGRAGSLVAREVTDHTASQNPPVVSALVFENYEVDSDISKNANMLLARGYLLPQVCADQNRTVSFIKNITPETPFASVPATISPNTIILDVPSGVRDIGIRERFHSLWVSSQASILEEADGSLHVIPYERNTRSVTLVQASPTKRAQQAILLTTLCYLTATAIYEKVKRCFREEKLL